MAKLDMDVPPGKQEVIIRRTFDAPRRLVFKAFTDPQLIPKWWGPASVRTVVDKMDAKHGGMWRFVHTADDGSGDAFHGVYHDVTAPERLIYTFEWEGLPGHVLLETITFEEHDAKTKITDTSVYQSVEDRDGMVAAGMESGAADSMDRMTELLREMK